ncbi:NAD(P)-dependent oxidoreductase [uncultured Marinobacter sp.]|uniref:NAD-dependent epimerase/dehydratase family protein n=1 Tax=uncultured Marinobacter sp. TaxID=187379 RepID=UPI002619C31E|nr:NAD(P)-dependent oxidoreductase [uncultured Marinobacter sp.]
MKVLIVGGSGMIGGNTALHLQELGHDVTLAARNPAKAGTLMAAMPIIFGDYTRQEFTKADLAPFEAIVFAAGNDIRHASPDEQTAEFWRAAQSEGVPAFAELARDAGVKRFIQLGSYYHQLRPDLLEGSPYLQARQLADDRARALATDDFNICTLNPPSIVGALPGLIAARYETLAAWGQGLRRDIPNTAPPGGTNYMSVRSLTQAVAGALDHAKTGKAYLVGDENLSFREFFQLFFDVANNPVEIVTVDEEHPLLPDAFIVQGRGNSLVYEPTPKETEALGYKRKDIKNAVREVISLISSAKQKS